MKNRHRKSEHGSLDTQAILKKIFRWQNILPFKTYRKFLCLFCSACVSTVLFFNPVIQAIAHQVILSESSNSLVQIPETLDFFKQGKNYYQSGNLSQAVEVWKKALSEYKKQGNVISEIQTLNYLALAYQDLGQLREAEDAISKSLNELNELNELNYSRGLLLGQALNTQASLQLIRGQTEAALATWEEATAAYKLSGDQLGNILSSINQAQAFQVLGQNRRSKLLLEQRLGELTNEPDNLLKAQGLRSLGVALQNLGELRQAKATLEQSWEISKQLNSPEDISAALFRIGNVARELKQYAVAWTYYEQAVNLSSNTLNQVEIQLNQLRVLIDAQRWQPALANGNHRR